MELAGVKAITISEGSVAKVFDSAGRVLWSANNAKTYTFTVQVKNSLGSASKEFSITIN